VTSGGYEEAGDTLFVLRTGGHFGLWGFQSRKNPDHQLQIDIHGAFVGQFDVDHQRDNIGWDGVYGLQLAWSPTPRLATRLALAHDSSHVGDEYAETTGRKRISYTRNEVTAGVSWSFAKRWRTYADGGYGYDLLNEVLQDPWRVRTGLEYQSGPWRAKSTLGGFAAADLNSYEEDDWSPNACVQLGLAWHVPVRSRAVRVGLEYYDGRSPIGEFFQDEITHVGLGVWLDL
jgi:hypothetical protein